MIYVHVPFCRSFCTYCDFYSEIPCAGRPEAGFRAYIDCLKAEIKARKAEIGNCTEPRTLYIGGGTPSLLPAELVGEIISSLAEAGAAEFDEFTVEVNPDDVSEAYISKLKSLGVNRISMGVQSLDDNLLRWMNRRHDSASAIKAADAIRKSGITNLSLDVIFGLSNLDATTLENTLDGIIRLHPEHVSAYQLSIEEGSALGSMVREGRYQPAADEVCAAQYELISRKLKAAGYRHYEISNWALPGFEAVHNSAYWSRRPYVGLGPGAHSFDGKCRSWNSEQTNGWSCAGSEKLSVAEAREETIMLGLRTALGILAEQIDSETLAAARNNGVLEVCNGRARIPESRLFVADDIISDLI